MRAKPSPIGPAGAKPMRVPPARGAIGPGGAIIGWRAEERALRRVSGGWTAMAAAARRLRFALWGVARITSAAGAALALLNLAAASGALVASLGGPAVFLPVAVAMLSFVGLGLLYAGDAASLLLAPGRRRLAPLLRLLLAPLWFYPLLALGNLALEPRWVARTVLPDGRAAALVSDPPFLVPRREHGLWVAEGPGWREVGPWHGAADGDADPTVELLASPDGTRLLARRAGAVVDCWELGRGFAACDGFSDPPPDRPPPG